MAWNLLKTQNILTASTLKGVLDRPREINLGLLQEFLHGFGSTQSASLRLPCRVFLEDAKREQFTFEDSDTRVLLAEILDQHERTLNLIQNYRFSHERLQLEAKAYEEKIVSLEAELSRLKARSGRT